VRRIIKSKTPIVSSGPRQRPSMFLALDLPDEQAALAAAEELVKQLGGEATVTDADGVEVGIVRGARKLDS
jgi:hypothetical protein